MVVTVTVTWLMINRHPARRGGGMPTTTETVAIEVANLRCLTMPQLWVLWDRHFQRRPDHVNRLSVEAQLAYKLQADALGGLSNKTRKRLEVIGAAHSNIKPRAKPQKFDFASGTVLVREWLGRDHRVTVTEDGQFEHEGKVFKTLTAVARHITGTHWSGPMFFGLNKKPEKFRRVPGQPEKGGAR